MARWGNTMAAAREGTALWQRPQDTGGVARRAFLSLKRNVGAILQLHEGHPMAGSREAPLLHHEGHTIAALTVELLFRLCCQCLCWQCLAEIQGRVGGPVRGLSLDALARQRGGAWGAPRDAAGDRACAFSPQPPHRQTRLWRRRSALIWHWRTSGPTKRAQGVGTGEDGTGVRKRAGGIAV